jgi:CRP-like cAMP-binding protein
MTAENYPVLGETSLVGQHTRSATVRCNSPCALYRIEAQPFLELALSDPAIGSAVFRRLSETLYERMESTSADVVKLSAALVYALEEQRGAVG